MTIDTAPRPARPLLTWMQAHPDRLTALLAEEATGEEDVTPASDAAIRAHLRFVVEALAANADAGARDRLEGLADRIAEDAIDPVRLEEAIDLVGAVTAHEFRLQFGASAAKDEALGDMAGRRVRIAAWHRVFLDELEGTLDRGGFDADEARTWMAGNQMTLADTIFAMDRLAKQREIDRGGPDAVASTEVANRIGQAATLHAHTRFLVDAVGRGLPAAA
ncbi:MAG: hypothetical protein AB7V62_11040 [Thermoleophilia bacterium]